MAAAAGGCFASAPPVRERWSSLRVITPSWWISPAGSRRQKLALSEAMSKPRNITPSSLPGSELSPVCRNRDPAGHTPSGALGTTGDWSGCLLCGSAEAPDDAIAPCLGTCLDRRRLRARAEFLGLALHR